MIERFFREVEREVNKTRSVDEIVVWHNGVKLIRVSIIMNPTIHSGIVPTQSESANTFKSGSLFKRNSGYHKEQVLKKTL